MRNSRESAICCGGGGGRMWIEPIEEERMRLAEIRLKEAAATGADVVLTACQFCMVNLQEAAKVVGSQVEVKDLIELVSERLAPDQHQVVS
jgi:Fe-S oxidoreductase